MNLETRTKLLKPVFANRLWSIILNYYLIKHLQNQVVRYSGWQSCSSEYRYDEPNSSEANMSALAVKAKDLQKLQKERGHVLGLGGQTVAFHVHTQTSLVEIIIGVAQEIGFRTVDFELLRQVNQCHDDGEAVYSPYFGGLGFDVLSMTKEVSADVEELRFFKQEVLAPLRKSGLHLLARRLHQAFLLPYADKSFDDFLLDSGDQMVLDGLRHDYQVEIKLWDLIERLSSIADVITWFTEPPWPKLKRLERSRAFVQVLSQQWRIIQHHPVAEVHLALGRLIIDELWSFEVRQALRDTVEELFIEYGQEVFYNPNISRGDPVRDEFGIARGP